MNTEELSAHLQYLQRKAYENTVNRQGVSPEALNAIRQINLKLDDVKSYPEMYEDPVQLIEDTEYQLQELWNFDKDREKHSHWYLIRGCKCPKIDNRDRQGYGRVINKDCPWHGQIEENLV